MYDDLHFPIFIFLCALKIMNIYGTSSKNMKNIVISMHKYKYSVISKYAKYSFCCLAFSQTLADFMH